MTSPSETSLFVGRLHPLLVHIPIGLLVAIVALEVVGSVPRWRGARAKAGWLLLLAVPGSALGAFCGWLLSRAGGYEPHLLQWHFWTGIATAVICALAGLLYKLGRPAAYRVCLALGFAALVLASHFGGSLTHGANYLTEYAPQPLRKFLGSRKPATVAVSAPKDPAQVEVFSGLIQPIFQKNCVGCHGPEKSKGGLRLDTFAAASKGGENGPVLLAGKPAESDLLRRLRLPLESEDHMPPDGKPQPAAGDLTLVEWWISAGAPAGKKVGELAPPPSIRDLLAARFGAPGPPVPAVTVLPAARAAEIAGRLAEELGVPVTMLSPTEPWIQCNASVAGGGFTDDDLARLAPIAANLRWLDLGGTAVSDSGLAAFPPLPNLARLHLERTSITDAAMTTVAKMAALEYLDLYGTRITDAGLERLASLPRLRQLYLWDTKVNPETAKQFAEERTDHDQLRRWHDEIAALETKIRQARFTVELGAAVPAPPATNATPVNVACPVSGKPVDKTKTTLHEGKLVAFCCDDCKAKFVQSPKDYLGKLALAASPANTTPGAPSTK